MSSASGIPYITYPMLVDALEPCKILVEPENHPSRFKWVSSPHWQQGVVSERDMLFVCQGRAAAVTASKHPDSLLVVVADRENVADLKQREGPLLIVEENAAAEGLLQRLQNYFLSIQSWQGELLQIPSSSDDSLNRILNKSARIVGAPLVLYGSDYQPMARALFNAGSPVCRKFLAKEHQVVNSSRAVRDSSLVAQEQNGEFVVLSASVGSEGKEPFLLLALFETMPTDGQCDLFEMLVASLEEHADYQTNQFNPTKFSPYALFDDLITGRYVGSGRLSDYSTNLSLPLDAEYRLYRFKFYKKTHRSDLRELAQSLRRVNGGKNVTVIYDGHPCLLLYSKGMDDSLSNNTIEKQLLTLFGASEGFIAASQVFDDIVNLKFAYQQTQLVAKYKNYVDLASFFSFADQPGGKLCYTFEEILGFTLVNPDDMNSELRDFSFSHTILDKIIAEDAENGGDDARILATYLRYERKATVVAEKLHMHRNTVLYRIGKIEKRFGLDFNENWTRDRLSFDFSVLYFKFMHNPDLFQKIMGCDAEAWISRERNIH